jgi:hypothetical protein
MSLIFLFSQMVVSKRALFSLLAGSLVLWSAYASRPSTGLCENFAVHAGFTFTFAGSNTISNNGDVGGSPIVGPTYVHVDGVEASTVDPALFINSVQAAWVAAMAIRADGNTVTGAAEMGGRTSTPGTWRSSAIDIAAGTVIILDGQNDPNPVFLFQAVSTMLTGMSCKIILMEPTTLWKAPFLLEPSPQSVYIECHTRSNRRSNCRHIRRQD